MSNSNHAFRIGRHRIEGILGFVLVAVWVVGAVVAVGLQNSVSV